MIKLAKASNIDLQTFYPDCLKITHIDETDRTLAIYMKSLKYNHMYPKCGKEMNAYYGTYERTVQDLPIFYKTVVLIITAYEYYCTNED